MQFRALICSLVMVAPMAAQTAPATAPRAFAFPDTMGANFNVADTATAKAAPDAMNFLLGTWRFRFQNRQTTGTFTPATDGEWTFTRNPADSLIIEDHWRLDASSRDAASGTYSHRNYNQQRGLWEMMGIATGNRLWEPGLIWGSGDTRFVIQHDGDALVRFRYFAITANHFLWRADWSTDNGKTWLRDVWTMEVNRIAK